MVKTKFYKLRSPKDMPEKYLALWSKNRYGEPIICPVNKEHQRLEKIYDLEVTIKNGKAFRYDVIWTWYSEPMINERVAKILKNEDLTGYELKPVTIKKISRSAPEKIPLLKELCAIGHAKVHDDTGLIVIEKCDVCGYVFCKGWKNKLIIDEEKWDGSDFFHLDPYPGGIFVSERVKEVFEKYKITGVEFIPSEECEDVWRTDEKESEKWEKYWDEVFTNLYPDLFPRISTREDKELFKWDVMDTMNPPCEKKKKKKRKEIEEEINKELEKLVERWEKGNVYLFSWDDVPGNDNDRFMSFLEYIVRMKLPEWNFGDIVRDIEIKKIDDGETIVAFTKKGFSLSFKLNKAEKKITLKISDEKIFEYDLKEEDGKLKVYKKVNLTK